METEEGYVYECIHCGFISKGEFEFCAVVGNLPPLSGLLTDK